MKKLFFIVFLIVLLPLVTAAKIQGTIYDLSLQKVPNTIIEINTEPSQKYISTDGKYAIEVPPGKYTIIARYPATSEQELVDIEEINVVQEGEFNIDIFLLDDLSSLEDYYNDTDMDTDFLENNNKSYWEYYLLIGLILIISIIFFYKRKKKEIIPAEKQEDIKELPKKILEFIKKEERITQKELRKKFPYSEAKISLVITELEHENKIKKIKKGRGNIIIINE